MVSLRKEQLQLCGEKKSDAYGPEALSIVEAGVVAVLLNLTRVLPQPLRGCMPGSGQ